MTRQENTPLNQELKKLLHQINDRPYTSLSIVSTQIQTLLKEGADINTQDDNGNTLLHLAVSSKNLTTFNAYIKETFKTNPETLKEITLDINKIISLYQPNPFVTNNEGYTPAMLSAKLLQESADYVATSMRNLFKNKYLSDSHLLLAYENKFQSRATALAIENINTMAQGLCYKKVEKVVVEAGESMIIERYQPSDHQPRAIVQAKERTYKIAQALQGKQHLPE